MVHSFKEQKFRHNDNCCSRNNMNKTYTPFFIRPPPPRFSSLGYRYPSLILRTWREYLVHGRLKT